MNCQRDVLRGDMRLRTLIWTGVPNPITKVAPSASPRNSLSATLRRRCASQFSAQLVTQGCRNGLVFFGPITQTLIVYSTLLNAFSQTCTFIHGRNAPPPSIMYA
jgi:hypothetical protein